MSGAATIFGGGGGVNYGVDSNGNPQQIKSDNQALRTVLYDPAGLPILDDAQALRTSLATHKTVPGDTLLRSASALIAGSAGDGILPIADFIYDGSNFVLNRGNSSSTLLASAVRSVQTITPIQTNVTWKGVILMLHITANPGGAETLSLGFSFNDPAGNGGPTIASLVAPAATNGLYSLFLCPGCTSVLDSVTNHKQYALPVPAAWYALLTPSGAGNWTYSLTAYLIH